MFGLFERASKKMGAATYRHFAKSIRAEKHGNWAIFPTQTDQPYQFCKKTNTSFVTID